MKRLIWSLALASLLAGCATTGTNGAYPPGPVHDPSSIYSDPTYPGPGVYFGVGAGIGGGRRGAGAGLGMGF